MRNTARTLLAVLLPGTGRHVDTAVNAARLVDRERLSADVHFNACCTAGNVAWSVGLRGCGPLRWGCRRRDRDVRRRCLRSRRCCGRGGWSGRGRRSGRRGGRRGGRRCNRCDRRLRRWRRCLRCWDSGTRRCSRWRSWGGWIDVINAGHPTLLRRGGWLHRDNSDRSDESSDTEDGHAETPTSTPGERGSQHVTYHRDLCNFLLDV